MASITQELQGAKDLVNAKGGELSALAKMYDSKGTYEPAPNAPITPDSIQGSVTPIQIPAQAVATKTDGVQSQLADQAKQGLQEYDLQKQELDKASEFESATAVSFQELIGSMLENPTKSELQLQAEKDAGLLGREDELNRLNNEILSEQNKLRRQIERIQREGGGLKVGAQAEIANLERESLQKQADLAILQMSAQGRYDSAKRIADQAAQAAFERQEMRVNALGMVYEYNKDLFDKHEQRAFEIAQDNRKRQLDFEKSQYELTQNTKLAALQMAQTNGAPMSVLSAISNAKTAEEVIAVGGQWGSVDLLSREQLRASIANSWASASLNQLKKTEAELAQKRIADAIENGEVYLADDQKDFAFKLSKEYENESGEFKKQVGAYNRIIASAENPSPAGDMALIFNYMKMLDPGSTVREGEYATAQNAGSVDDRTIAIYNKVVNGQSLSQTQRDDFVDRSDNIYTYSLEQQQALEDRYRDQAVRLYNLPENAADLIIQDIRATGATSNASFSMKFDSLSTAQLDYLNSQNLLPSFSSTTQYGSQ